MSKQKTDEKKWKKFVEQKDSGEDTQPETTTTPPDIKGSIEYPPHEALDDQLTIAEQKAQENWSKYLAALAEFDNYKKRAERDLSNAYKFSVEKLLNELLPVLDSLEKSLEVQDKSEAFQTMRQGIELTIKMFLDVLAKFGVKQINPLGKIFDPSFHEAVAMQEDPNLESNIVMAVYQKGYTLHDRLVRPARVVVAK